jgi:hypothetical protein
MPSGPLYTDFLCLLADPLGFEDPPPGFPVAEQTHRWLAMQSRPVSYVVCVLLSHLRPLLILLHILVPPLALQAPLLP